VEGWFSFASDLVNRYVVWLGSILKCYAVLIGIVNGHGGYRVRQEVPFMLNSHFRSRREGFFGRIPPPSKNQGADESVVADGWEVAGDRSGGVQLVVGRNVHAARDRIPKNHVVSVVDASDGEADATLNVEIAAFDAGIGDATVIADAPPFKEIPIVGPFPVEQLERSSQFGSGDRVVDTGGLFGGSGRSEPVVNGRSVVISWLIGRCLFLVFAGHHIHPDV
jgi:hypothetical protein